MSFLFEAFFFFSFGESEMPTHVHLGLGFELRVRIANLSDALQTLQVVWTQ